VLFPTPAETPDADEVDEDRVQARLRGVADPGRPWSVLHTSLYRVHQRVASSFRVGRVLLAGDAAHVNNPLGGMGMNSGIHDAVELGGALATVIAGGEDRLDEVAARRRWVATDYVKTQTHGNWEQIRESDPTARERLHAELRERAADPVKMRDFLLTSSMIDSLRTVVR
jgi:3-(3-hydroxy-phenyl)propionate hydroxylase